MPTHALLPLLQPRADSDSLGPYEHVFIEYLLCARHTVDLGDRVLIILSAGMHTSPSAQALASLGFHLCINHDHRLSSELL